MAAVAKRLSGHELTTALRSIPAWTAKTPAKDGRDVIQRRLEFGDFKAAWAFMNGIALHAEAANHHPEWFNVYNRVEIVLTTHDSGGITAKDIELAGAIDSWAKTLGGKDSKPMQ